ncbi:DKNYY domain-containing protein [Prevotella multiformis]|uniref:DKNYY domain-containing protein n=1 Tax=Prevotella multiformis TaxID=282402 RepID=UPI001BA66A52|nr:DKNYY domain-containing protein [Prevotella multiformis]QUB72182.1 DKNYY domain-containing protein [Prevotella multiformis]
MRFYVIISVLCVFVVSCKSRKYDYIDKGKWVSLEKGMSIDGYTRVGDSIYGGYGDSVYLHTSVRALKDVDINSFKVCKNTGYAKDANHVYYPLRIICEDALEFGGCYFKDYIMENVSPEEFKYIGKGYATDGYNLFKDGKEINLRFIRHLE